MNLARANLLASIALLGKQTWNLFNKRHKVRVKVYKHMYLKPQNLFKATTPPFSSIKWRFILKPSPIRVVEGRGHWWWL